MPDPKTYEYHGMIAEYWDLLRGDTSGWSSRPYFLDAICRSGEPALDVGCSTGRLLLDYLQEGVDIDGVDVSAEMLAVCRRNADKLGLNPVLYQGAMEDFEILRQYQMIIVPSSSFLLVTDHEAQVRALRQFKKHLLPGGLLSMSLRWFDPDPAEEVDYEVILDGEVIESEAYSWATALTWRYSSEAVALMTEVGFTDVQAYADFTLDPATDEDQSYTVEGRHP